MNTQKRISIALLLFLLVCGVVSAQQEVTLTTYYPAPRGDYETLRLVPSSAGAGENQPCNGATEAGLMYYDETNNAVLFCDGSSNTWESMGGERYWKTGEDDPQEIYARETPWRFSMGQTGIGADRNVAYRLYLAPDPSINAGLYAQGVAIGVDGVASDITGDGVVGSGSETGVVGWGGSFGLWGDGDTGVGVLGMGDTYGLWGTNPNVPLFPLYGVWGDGSVEGVHGSGPIGVIGFGDDEGVIGRINPASPTVTTYAVRGEDGTYGVWGQGTETGVYGLGPINGVFGESTDPGSFGVRGYASDPFNTYGVRAEGGAGGLWASGNVTGIYTVGGTYGIYGFAPTAALFDGNVIVNGNLNVSGTLTKGTLVGFVQPHPQDPSKQIDYLVMEGRESRVFFDGTATLRKGEAAISVPEDFRLVASGENLNVILTPFGETEGLYVKERSLQKIIVKEKNSGTSDASFGYLVIGTRKGFEEARPIQENTHFRPDAYTTEEDFEKRFEGEEGDGEYYSRLALKLNRDLLVSNGTLHPNGQVNSKTTSRLGWEFSKEKREAFLRGGGSQ